MGYTLITLTDEEVSSGEIAVTEVVDILARRIRNAATLARETTIAVKLRPEMEAGVELLELIERWVVTCTGNGKRLVVLPVTAEQSEALSVSHPDQHIEFVATLEDIILLYGQESLPQKADLPAAPLPVKPEPPVIEVEGPSPVEPEAEIAAERPVHPLLMIEPVKAAPPAQPSVATPVIMAGSMVSIAGEYTCLTCLASRTWLKGDRITSCDNPECLNPAAGFHLSCDLF